MARLVAAPAVVVDLAVVAVVARAAVVVVLVAVAAALVAVVAAPVAEVAALDLQLRQEYLNRVAVPVDPV